MTALNQTNKQTRVIKDASFRGDIHLKKGKRSDAPEKVVTHDEGEVQKGYEACGSGSQSRIGLDFDKLGEASWRIMHFSPVFSWLQDRH